MSARWIAGGYARRRRQTPVAEANSSSVFHQEFDCSVVVYFSSFPQTLEQKKSGIRFAADDTAVPSLNQKLVTR